MHMSVPEILFLVRSSFQYKLYLYIHVYMNMSVTPFTDDTPLCVRNTFSTAAYR